MLLKAAHALVGCNMTDVPRMRLARNRLERLVLNDEVDAQKANYELTGMSEDEFYDAVDGERPAKISANLELALEHLFNEMY